MLVREALAAGIELEAIYVDADDGVLLREFDGAIPVAAGVLATVLSTVTPQPACAVASLSLAQGLDQLIERAVSTGRPLVVLVDVADPGNAGTIVRAAEASGCAGVVFAGATVEAYSPKVVRSSAASVLRVPFAVERDVAAALGALSAGGVTAVAAVARDGQPHLEAPLAAAVAIVVGNEAHGLSDDDVARCDSTVTIGMDGPSESLNVAMAATVLCFEALRQRHAAK